MPPNSNNPGSFKWITISSFILSIVLFGLCVWFIIGKSCFTGTCSTKNGRTAYDSISTVLKQDTVVAEAGRKTIINNSSTTKYNNSAADGTDDISKRLEAVFKYFLLLFGVFVLLTLLPRIKSFDIGKDGVKAELYELVNAYNAAQNQSAHISNEPTGGTQKTEENKIAFNIEKKKMTNLVNASDPYKGFGEDQSVKDNRQLTALIEPIIGSEWANITLRVSSTNPKNDPLTGIVIFHLHPTFANPDPVIIAVNGIAELKIKAWGAFTVGVECNDKNTRLELDLAKHPQAFAPFKDR